MLGSAVAVCLTASRPRPALSCPALPCPPVLPCPVQPSSVCVPPQGPHGVYFVPQYIVSSTSTGIIQTRLRGVARAGLTFAELGAMAGQPQIITALPFLFSKWLNFFKVCFGPSTVGENSF